MTGTSLKLIVPARSARWIIASVTSRGLALEVERHDLVVDVGAATR